MALKLEQGHIVAIEVLDPENRNPKVRPVVIVSPTDEIGFDAPFWGVAITGTLPRLLPKEYVPIPYHRAGHPRTGLKKRCAAKCDWFVEIHNDQVVRSIGRVPVAVLSSIIQQVDALK